MNLIDLHNHFKEQLRSIYEKEEISIFFYMLTEYRLKLDRVAIALEPNYKLSLDDFVYYKDALLHLAEQKPIQYFIGETSFYSLDFYLTPETLIPRPETEELVAWILQEIAENFKSKTIKILDIGTGSGAIAISLAKNAPNVNVTAIDISSQALEVAKKNAKRNDVDIDFLKIDILKTANLQEDYDIIVSNPPYVRDLEKKEMQKNVLLYEPSLALFVSDDSPLIFYKKITELAKNHLTSKGLLFFEINQYLGKETVELVEKMDFTTVELRKDFLENDRMIKASFE